MIWNIAISALAFTALLSMLGSVWKIGAGQPENNRSGPLQSFLLADEGLRRFSVANLLFSTSFSLNGMLYQAWLGYQIGLWALVVQGAWALSYVLLSAHAASIREDRSLHAFLGKRFGVATQVLAGLCSIVGFMVLIGWEFNVGRATFEGLLSLRPNETTSPNLILMFTISAVGVCFLYTILGGLKSNVVANYLQNGVKIVVFLLLIGLLYAAAARATPAYVGPELFPPFSKVLGTLGLIGFITNIVFSLAWQFVDMSTWHSVTASKKALSESEAQTALRFGGLLVFIAPGIIGTLLGAFLAVDSSVTGDNIMSKVVSSLPSDNPVLLFLVFAALLASIMSTIDGLLLASAYSLVCDIVYREKSLAEVDSDLRRSHLLLGLIRIFLGVIAVVGTLGVYWLLWWSGLSLFDIVYVLIVGQLALFGAVTTGIRRKTPTSGNMVWSIIAGLLVGGAAVVAGKSGAAPSWLLESAGVMSLASSWVVARLIR